MNTLKIELQLQQVQLQLQLYKDKSYFNADKYGDSPTFDVILNRLNETESLLAETVHRNRSLNYILIFHTSPHIRTHLKEIRHRVIPRNTYV
jgi:hypothetical protein